jgi:hypothetical protein
MWLTPHPPAARTVAVEAPPLLPQFLTNAVEPVARARVITATASGFKGSPLPDQGSDALTLSMSVPGNSRDDDTCGKKGAREHGIKLL